jgi:hypothetical protein
MLVAHVAASDSTVQPLIDGRESFPDDDTSEWTQHPAVLIAGRDAEKFWRARNVVYEHDFRVMAAASGAFTKTAATQTSVLYLLSRWPRATPNMGLAVVDAGGKLLHNFVFEASTQRLATADIDGDGLDELMLIGSFGMGGSNETYFTLLSLRDGNPLQLAEMVVAADSCASGAEGRGSTAFVVSLQSGSMLRSEQFSRTCDGSSQWRADSVEQKPLGKPTTWTHTELSSNLSY